MEAQLELDSVIKKHTSDINAVKITKLRVYSASGDKEIRVHQRDQQDWTEKPWSPLRGHKYYVNTVTVCATEELMASGSTDGSVVVWRLSDGVQVASLSHPSRTGVRAVRFSLSGRLLVSGAEDGSVCVWSRSGDSWRLSGCLLEHDDCCYCCIFTPDSEVIVTGSGNGYMRVWDCTSILHSPSSVRSTVVRSCAHDFGVTGGSMSSVFYIKEHCIRYEFVTCGGDDQLKIWSLQIPRLCQDSTKPNLDLLRTLKGHSRIVTCCEYSEDGRLICSVSMDHSLIIWDSRTGSQLASIEVEDNYVNACSICLEIGLVATGGYEKSVKLWRLRLTNTLPDGTEECIQAVTADTKASAKVKSLSKESDQRDRVVLPTQYVEHWTIEQVVQFFSHHSNATSIGRYSQLWYRHGVTGATLLSLTDDDLEHRLGIEVVGHRRIITDLIRTLFEANKRDKDLVESAAESQWPRELFCPITHEIMQDPVVAADGFSYERTAIEAWFSLANQSTPQAHSANQNPAHLPLAARSPITNELLSHARLTPNMALRTIIKQMQQYH